VAQLPEPTAKRLQRPSWRDARLLVGVVLVLLGTVIGARLIAAKPGDGHTFPDDFRCTGTHGRDPVTGRATTCGVKP